MNAAFASKMARLRQLLAEREKVIVVQFTGYTDSTPLSEGTLRLADGRVVKALTGSARARAAEMQRLREEAEQRVRAHPELALPPGHADVSAQDAPRWTRASVPAAAAPVATTPVGAKGVPRRAHDAAERTSKSSTVAAPAAPAPARRSAPQRDADDAPDVTAAPNADRAADGQHGAHTVAVLPAARQWPTPFRLAPGQRPSRREAQQ